MIKTKTAGILILLLFLLSIPVGMDVAISIVPGWHTAIYTPYFIMGLVVALMLFFVTVAYWRLYRRLERIKSSQFLTHIILTLPAVLHLRLPLLTFYVLPQSQFEMALPLVLILFAIGQIFFFVYYIKLIKA